MAGSRPECVGGTCQAGFSLTIKPSIHATFLCDEMLLALARWLRAAGYDAACAVPGLPDALLVARAGAEGRMLLTRDRGILQHKAAAGLALLLEGEDMDAWALELKRRLALDWRLAPFSRCLKCNRPLSPATAEAWAGVPADARILGPLQWCAQCRRPYWRGGHVRRMEARLALWDEARP